MAVASDRCRHASDLAIVDVTNLVLLGLGQPLHAFDAGKLRAPSWCAGRGGGAAPPSTASTATLHPDDLVIADDSGPVALAGVMGGACTEISASTTEVALESAHFDATVVARTSRRHGLASEASRRFERGVDPELAPYARASSPRDDAGARAERCCSPRPVPRCAGPSVLPAR